MMSVITLLTDFGTDDEYVGLMKGVILSINPAVSIVDITHRIDPQDIAQAAYSIQSSYRYFPKGTIHLVVVDPGVGGGRAIIALEMSEHVFLAPDNGVLTLLLNEEEKVSLFRVENSDLFLRSVSKTFHGRDIIAPVGAYLAKGLEINKLGCKIDMKDVVRLDDLTARISARGELVGKIVAIDRFGNLITNIDSKTLTDYCKAGDRDRLRIRIGSRVISGVFETYASVAAKTALALIGSRGYLEVAVNQGSASKHFKVEKGDRVQLVIQ